jgi:RHS repeat-associated protein
MRSFLVCFSILWFSWQVASAQEQPDLNGFKPYGAYDGSGIDSVNLQTGNLIIHIPVPVLYPQRGGELNLKWLLAANSMNWSCVTFSTTCRWDLVAAKSVEAIGSGIGLDHSLDMAVHRVRHLSSTDEDVGSYFIRTSDGNSHQLVDTAGNRRSFDAIDTSGWHVELSGADSFGNATTGLAIDRQGNRYQLNTFFGLGQSNGCNPATGCEIVTTYTEYAKPTNVTDANGNIFSLNTSNGDFSSYKDTMGRPHPGFASVSSDNTGCLLSGQQFSSAVTYPFPGFGGAGLQLKFCYATTPYSTAFSTPSTAIQGSGFSGSQLATVIMPDSTKWVFAYDTYGNISSVGLPLGGSISYTWTEIPARDCVSGRRDPHRAVSTRTLSDNHGHSYQWSYHYATGTACPFTNSVTDPLLNDADHVFTALALDQIFETSTVSYQGTGSGRKALQKIDTGYYISTIAGIDQFGHSAPAVGNVVPNSITTTMYPSLNVKQTLKTPDPGPGNGRPIYGVTVVEKEYDWGQGGPGAFLRETDNVYLWQTADALGNHPYALANLLDLPASTVVISPSASANVKSSCPVNAMGGTAVCMTETDYGYDETGYSQGYTGSLPTGTHGTAPNPSPIRGNQTSLKSWLNAASGFVAEHTSWYDTGEKYQTIDPLNHTVTFTYDPTYAGAYVTQTCPPTTNGVTHCVSGAYDFTSGLLTAFTDQNGGTSNYGYDIFGRLTLGQEPADPTNGNSRPNISFTFPVTVSFPFTFTRNKSITPSLSDSVTTLLDGVGRPYQTQHAVPGNTAVVDTSFDAFGHVGTVSNPHFTTSDPTYGNTSHLYDGLDRITQVTKQDGSVNKTAYSVVTTIPVNGNCTITTDEAGKQRGTCTDSLGRLVEVDEPNPGTPINVNNHVTMQTDGNFVLFNSTSASLWSTGTGGTNAQSIFMQDDGNLVLYIFKWQAGVYAAPSPGPFAPQSCSISSYLVAGQRISPNQCIVSPHGQYMLYMAPYGNLFIYDIAHAVGTWGTNTNSAGAYATLQTDGNLVVYATNGVALWNSGTSGTFAERLDMEDDGRIIIYKSAWNSGTSNGQFNGSVIAHPGCDVGIGTGSTGVLGSGQCFVSPNGHFELLLQGDGNMVIYDLSVAPNKALWSTDTAISPADPGFAMRTLYAYDALGNLLRVDQKGTAPSDSSQWRTRTFTYDPLSRLLTAANPESGTITYAYDADGHLLQKTSPAPNQTGSATQTVSYCYDELNRVTSKGYGAQSCPLATPVVTYAYDSGTNAKGHLTALTDQAGTASYTYDILGRLTTETRPIAGVSKSTSYTYNLDGSVKTLTYPSGRIVTYTPDSAGRLVSAVDGNGANYVTSAIYNPDSSLKSLVNGSTPALNQTLQYTPRLQLCRITTLTSGTLPTSCTDSQHIGNIMDRGYDFHAGNGTAGSGTDNGNVFAITNYRDANRSQAFTYDALNRLASGWSSANTGAFSWGENYSIDAWGNLQLTPMSGKAHGGNFTLSGNVQNRPTGMAYDAAGNLMSYASSTYTYDQENRLSSTAGMSYTYDANGERVLKSNTSTGAAVKRYWSMGGNTLAEGDGSGNLTAEYVYFGGKRVARIDLPANTVHYYLSDHLGSTSIVATAAGAVEQESDYYPFGAELVVTGGVNELKFTGKRRDTESQLDYFGARYYSNTLGRFNSPDWNKKATPVPYANYTDPQSLNLYGYVRNNPVWRSDVDGHGFWTKLKNALSDGGWNEDADAQKERGRRLHARADQARKDLSALRGLNIGGQSAQHFAQTASDQDVLAAERAVTEALANECCMLFGQQMQAALVPAAATETLESIDKNGSAPNGQQGGSTFENREGRLPQNDANGKPIQYKEWDTSPKQPGANRGAERVVTGSDGSAYYTSDHYLTFTKVR